MEDWIHNAVSFLDSLPPWVGGILMALLISFLRVVYDQEETSFVRIIMESLICGLLTLSVGSAIIALGYDSQWYLFCGGVIGFMGSQTIRAIAVKFITKQTNVNLEKSKNEKE